MGRKIGKGKREEKGQEKGEEERGGGNRWEEETGGRNRTLEMVGTESWLYIFRGVGCETCISKAILMKISQIF